MGRNCSNDGPARGRRRWRRLGLAAAIAALPLAGIGTATASAADPYNVLVFTKNATVGAAEGVAALQASAPADATFDVSDDASKFTATGLAPYKAVVFLNTSGDVLDNTQQTAYETYFKAGGGFLGIGSAIETEPDWAFFTSLLGTRSSGRTDALQATIKVADRGHSASKDLPEYWTRTDRWYNFTSNVRGFSHVLATVDEKTYTGGTMTALADHPIIWCKDYQGGRSFYTAGGNTAESFAEPNFRRHLGGAVLWTAGKADPVYSDCGATVLANYQQTKISAPPNLNEPIGFDQLPDGRILQTARAGQVRLHDPVKGTSQVIANIPVYTHSEDGLYGPAVDADFATNKWVYVYYSPQTVTIKKCDGTMADVTTPNGTAAPVAAADPCVWTDNWAGYFQLSRFKFVDGATPSLDMASEQKILKVDVNRGACCHVAGDIDFDKHGNLWLVTGDDTPAGSGNSGGFSPHNDMKTNETQTLRVNGATGGTFTLTFGGQTTAPIPYNATAAQTQAALEGLDNIAVGDILVTGNPINTGNQSVAFRGGYTQMNVSQITGNAAGLTGTGAAVSGTTAATSEGDLFQAPFVDARRTAQNTNDLRGKVLRIKVGADGSYTIPEGNMFAPGTAKTRPEIYAMGFRNPFRIQVDSNDVAYVTDYSPDSRVPENFRGPAGTGRVEIVRKPTNYGWPLCYSPSLPYYRWNFNTSTPLDPTPTAYECNNPTRGPQNTSRWVRDGGPSNEPGLEYAPPIAQPDLWYAYQDNATPPLGTPCLASYNGSGAAACPQLFPELFAGGVAPHGAAKYEFNPANPSKTKFPAYYDNAVFFGEFGQDTLREVRLDSQNNVFKINQLLNCGGVQFNRVQPFECDNPMDMQFGADGAFYLLTYGDGFFAANPDAGMYKWEYVKGQRAPNAVLGTDKTDGPAPLSVQFSSAGTVDADPGDSLTYEWDFTNDGTVDSTAPNASHTYTTRGVYTAKLTVTDSSGKRDIKSTIITVGNTSPTITIQVPNDGDFFEWGQRIPYKVIVTDPEDASIDCSKVQVTFVLIHGEHGHAEDGKTGCTGWLDTLTEDASHGGYIAGGVSASYTDTGSGTVPALTTIKQHVVQIKRQQVEYATQASGTTVIAAPAAEVDPGGGQVASSLDAGDWVALNNKYNLANMNKKVTFRFAGGSATNPAGSDRAAVEIRTGSETGPIVQTVTLKSTGTNNNTYASQTFDLNYSGSERLFFVFRAITGTGVPTAAFGNLNWVEFSGPGVGLAPDFFPAKDVAVGGTVPATLSLSLGAPATFGAFTPGVANVYTAQTTANVISTAGDATLSVADPSSNHTGQLVNGAFFLPQALQANAKGGAFAPVGGSASPTPLYTYSGPVSNDSATIGFRQSIGANDALRTGAYSKTLTFTLSTTTP
jgi:PKD repeat protein/glucose/arabinose dehydrogenase/type 1 glutamine amidotransferase